MYKIPILTASFVFILASVIEIFAIELLRGSLAVWLDQPHHVLLLVVMIGINAVDAALFGYAAHRAAVNALLLRRAEQDRYELTERLREQLRPALSIVQYAAYNTADKHCIEICNEAIAKVVNTVTEAESGIGHRQWASVPIEKST